jgi:hypothetical protein
LASICFSTAGNAGLGWRHPFDRHLLFCSADWMASTCSSVRRCSNRVRAPGASHTLRAPRAQRAPKVVTRSVWAYRCRCSCRRGSRTGGWRPQWRWDQHRFTRPLSG